MSLISTPHLDLLLHGPELLIEVDRPVLEVSQPPLLLLLLPLADEGLSLEVLAALLQLINLQVSKHRRVTHWQQQQQEMHCALGWSC
jgi:hypothetical protein